MTQKNTFRIARKNENYYPQVKIKNKFLVPTWYRIGKHIDGFGLYDDDDYSHPKTQKKCEEIIREYEKWQLSQNNPVEYIEFNP